MKKYLSFFVLLFAFKNSYSQCVTTYSTTNVSVCYNQIPYWWNGYYYYPGTPNVVYLTNYKGCDSVATLNVYAVDPPTPSVTNVNICANKLPYYWNGKYYYQQDATAGYIEVSIPNGTPCDSLADLNLFVYPNATSETDDTVCGNQLPFVWNGNSYTTSGTYTKNFPKGTDCDSIATLVLTVNPVPTITSFAPATGGKGQAVLITGTNFTGAKAVSIGGSPATSFYVESPTTIVATAGATSSGPVSVTTCTTASLAGFTYVAGSGGGIGIGTNNATSKLTVGGGDIQVQDIGSGIIFKTEDGRCWRLTMTLNAFISTDPAPNSNVGLKVTEIPCP